MSVCPEDLENGVSKLLPNHNTLLEISSGSVFFFCFSLGLLNIL